MRIDQLKEELIKNNINLNSCLINPKVCSEGALCLTKEDDDSWLVTLNERGDFLIKERFYTEHDACRFYFLQVLSEPTYRNDFKPSDLLDFKKRKEALLREHGYLKSAKGEGVKSTLDSC